MTTTQAPTSTEASDSTGDQAKQEAPAKGIGSAVGAAAFGLGSALAVAALMPAWLGYIVVALVAAWLVAVSVPYIRKWRSA